MPLIIRLLYLKYTFSVGVIKYHFMMPTDMMRIAMKPIDIESKLIL